MQLSDDAAVQAARDITVEKTDAGYEIRGAPDEHVTAQHDTDQIPEKDVTQEMIANTRGDPTSWLTYGGGYKQHRYTTADVITKENVDGLQLEYLVQTGTLSSMEGTPLIVPGDPPIMYQTNGPDHGKAINARTGEILWSYVYPNPQDNVVCCDANTRGFAIWGDKVYMGTLDSGVVALDRYTGEKQWYQSTAENHAGYSLTAAPIAYDGKIFVGSAGADYGIRGFRAALDAESGEMLWKSTNVPKDKWVGDSYVHAGASSWQAPAVDTERNMLYFPSGNPGPDFNGAVRPGPNRYSTGTIAVDADTGDVEWHFADSLHDTWDYDSSCPKLLIRDQRIRGESHDVVVHGGKTGWTYTQDADTGKLLRRSEESIQHINMWEMVPYDENEDDRLQYVPANLGGNNWQPPSYSPKTGLVYVKQQNQPVELTWKHPNYEQGVYYLAGGIYDWPDLTNIPEEWNGKTSAIVALDPITGERVWREWSRDDTYLLGGSLTTATGLTIMGTQKGRVVAFDGETGERLWEEQLGASISGSPVSWYDPGTEKQYVAVQVGGAGPFHAGRRGSTIGVFALQN
ncbi:MAG: pyrroloquinoline quinone-dependent dehydrogenase [Haloplanus sp.]